MGNKIQSLIKKIGGLVFGGRSNNERRADPVCGMKVASETFMADHNGKSYYFCSDHCRQQFVANPSGYIS